MSGAAGGWEFVPDGREYDVTLEDRMKYKCMIFDLDGTLVNSLPALVHCTNLALARFGLGTVDEEQMKTMAGDGYRMQMERALKAAGDPELTHHAAILPVYMEIFAKDCLYKVHPYAGIRELLETAKKKGMKLAVVSNKPRQQTIDTVEAIFGKGCFDVIIGEAPDVPKKPDPTGAKKAAKLMGAKPSECLYLGDTNTDMHTGKNAGMDTVGVLWGFRSREELAALHPDYLVENPKQAEELI